MSVVVGVTGFASSGKDTVADILVEKFGYVKVSWADPLRRDLSILNPIVHSATVNGVTTNIRYNEAIERFGYTEAKMMFDAEIRKLLQRYGTEVHRSINENYWIDRTLDAIEAMTDTERFVIPDTRFPNEARACDKLIGVRRPGVGAINDHASDAGLAFDFVSIWIDNDGTLEDLEQKVMNCFL